MLTIEDLSKILLLAENAATSAGKYLLRREALDATSTKNRDTKLRADTEAEKIILDLIRAGSSFPILSEEAGGDFKSGPIWFVDPLDGTVNYSRGLPICVVSISLWSDGKPLLGVVYDFNRGELFSGIVGHGASINSRKIEVSRSTSRDNAIVFAGFPVATDFTDAAVANFLELVRDFKKVRMLGSAALSLAYVAAGRGDAYFERRIRIWDVAGGIALVAASGGQYKYLVHEKSDVLTVYADNGKLPPLI
jgi:myo-inositol-1(or 4)-monophosphatase